MTDNITIKGTAPKFDDQVLKQLQQGYHHMYRNTDQRCTVVRDKLAYSFLAKVVEMSAEGYVLTPNYPISTSPADYSVFMVKPDHIQAADLIAIDAKVKQEYIEKLEREREDFKLKLIAQRLQAAELKEKKREDDKRAKLLADIEKEVNDMFGDLVTPE